MCTVAAMPSIISRASTIRRVLLAALPLAVALAGLPASHAYAAEGGQYPLGEYGEVTRFGEFDTTWFDNGVDTGKSGGSAGTDSSPTPGKLLNSVGFAVDSDDEGTGATAVYVLERVSGLASQVGARGTEWRLQKLSATGAPLASSLFYLPADVVSGANYNVFVGVSGLVVDDSTGTVYSVLYDTTGSGAAATRQAAEVIDWSTKPSGNQLVAPSGASTTDSPDTAITPEVGYSHPGVLSVASQLTGTPLYEPEGVALDVTGGQDYLAIEADAAPRASSGFNSGALQGPAIVQQIATSGPQAGDEAASWSAVSLTTPSLLANASTEDATAFAAGISTSSDGSLNVLLATAAERNSRGFDDITLPADLTGPTVIDSKAINPSYEGSEYPKGGNVDNAEPIPLSNQLVGLSRGGAGGASSPVVGLTNGLSASYSSISTLGFGYWNQQKNEGIRLVRPEAGGLLTNSLAPVTSVYDTLGNATPGTPGGTCYIGNIGYAENTVSLAAGADGTIWALVAGEDDSEGNVTGREVIEYAPGASKQCAGPGPSGATFTVAEEHGTPQPASTPLKVTVGSTVDFDAAPIEYPPGNNEKPAGIYAYEWAPTGATNGYTIVKDTLGENGNLETESKFAPEASANYTYDTPGVYPVALKLLGDFGAYDETGSVVVQTTSPPTASFTAPAEAQAGQSVSFDASASKEATGAQILNYHWNFGDGQSDDTQTSSDTHPYASPGTYTVTLKVRDNDNQESAAFTQQITIVSPPSGGGGGGGSTGGGSTGGGGTLTGNVTPVSVATTATTTPTPSSVPAGSSAPAGSGKPKALTTAQKLASALKVCKKDKSKAKRASCEKQAKKKYAAKPKPKAKSKKKSGKGK
jgi:PKD repeat protein